MFLPTVAGCRYQKRRQRYVDGQVVLYFRNPNSAHIDGTSVSYLCNRREGKVRPVGRGAAFARRAKNGEVLMYVVPACEPFDHECCYSNRTEVRDVDEPSPSTVGNGTPTTVRWSKRPSGPRHLVSCLGKDHACAMPRHCSENPPARASLARVFFQRKRGVPA
jgi:hypothetical protein